MQSLYLQYMFLIIQLKGLSHTINWAFDYRNLCFYIGLVRFTHFCGESPSFVNRVYTSLPRSRRFKPASYVFGRTHYS
jgi:hypothetical protein